VQVGTANERTAHARQSLAILGWLASYQKEWLRPDIMAA